jgi:hypothetical protein
MGDKMVRDVFFTAFIFGLLAFTGCVRAGDQRQDLAGEIDRMTQDLSCDVTTECKVFGFGDKPCGGYQTYRLYSTKTTDEHALLSKAADHLALDKKHNQAIGMMSTCDLVAPPQTTCQNGQCVVVGMEPLSE